MATRRAARSVIVLAQMALAAILLSACTGITPDYTPIPIKPTDDTYHPVPQEHPTCVETLAYVEEGEASWYGRTKKMRRTASGQPLDPNAPTAAHRYLPLGSKIRVINLANGNQMVVTINDRGPFTKGRIIDVSQRSARDLGFLQAGITRVRIESTEPTKSEC